jgi:ribosomal protein S18 acetylase RimI-like enzyme
VATIRQLYPGDSFLFLSFIRSLDRKTWESYGRWDWPLNNRTNFYYNIAKTQSFKKDIEEIGLILIINEPTNPTIAGYAHLMFSNKSSRSHSCGFGIVIHQDYQKQGLGEILMKDVLKLAKDIGKKKVWLHVYANNKPALALYNKFGFKEEGRFRKEELKDNKYIDVLSLAKFL